MKSVLKWRKLDSSFLCYLVYVFHLLSFWVKVWDGLGGKWETFVAGAFENRLKAVKKFSHGIFVWQFARIFWKIDSLFLAHLLSIGSKCVSFRLHLWISFFLSTLLLIEMRKPAAILLFVFESIVLFSSIYSIQLYLKPFLTRKPAVMLSYKL